MLLQQSRLCFRPAGVDLPSGAETDHGEPARPRAALAVSPWFFCRRSRPPIRKTAELPNAAPLWASVLRSVLGGVFSFRQNGDLVWRTSRATTLFRESRVRFCFAGVDAIEWETQTSERTLRGRGISVASALRLPPRTYPCRRATSDVREQAKRSRGSYGVAMSTFEERGRSGRKT